MTSPEQTIYSDTVIEVSFFPDDGESDVKSIGIKYLQPTDYVGKEGNPVKVSNAMGGETDWFILPHTFGAAVGKKLMEQWSAGLEGFNDKGLKMLKEWLIEYEIIDDAMCY